MEHITSAAGGPAILVGPLIGHRREENNEKSNIDACAANVLNVLKLNFGPREMAEVKYWTGLGKWKSPETFTGGGEKKPSLCTG